MLFCDRNYILKNEISMNLKNVDRNELYHFILMKIIYIKLNWILLQLNFEMILGKLDNTFLIYCEIINKLFIICDWNVKQLN